MINNKTFIAIIPARAGSKRLPGKNILDLNGKPLIEWSIQASLGSIYIDKTMVTTDDDAIIEVSRKAGAEVPFKRPDDISTDVAKSSDVIKHTVDFYYDSLKKKFDYIVFLQPTSPLRTSTEIDKAIEYMFQKNADAVVSVCKLEHPVEWSGILPIDMDMSKFLSRTQVKLRGQDLPSQYRLNGAIYICNTERFLEQGSMFLDDNIYAYEMGQIDSVDIDTEADFKIAEILLKIK